ncbi:glycosyltransferase 87 family protein [Oscillatoria sp. CS-180]|uniref:glycosyltransferase 87 family protein n=1 Tax=Oscillatoria sp. CS-180 TaxID=3021720 RepID=UPI00232E443B|nr:glycosyltransferase 87 family protein [Oscillatoria sp. CS-180]MDB9529334.1 glycosyltransferase 87 family protein [Oscillatoria sp. CS-180]
MVNVQRLWMGHRHKLLPVAVGLLSVSCLNRLLKEFVRLIWGSGNSGAIDLKIFYEAVQLWFSGVPTYAELPSAVYPPASYLMMWPFLGWLAVPPARILWAVMTAIALVWLIYLVIQESHAETWAEKALIGLLPIFYATRTGIGNGQLVVFLMPSLIAGLLLFHRCAQLPQRLLAAAMVVGALIKPNVTAPFFWMVMFASRGQWYLPNVFVLVGYGLLTLWAAAFQDASAIALMRQWFSQAEVGAEFGAQTGGYANQNSLMSWLEANTNLDGHPLLTFIGDFELNTPLTLTVLFVLGVWVLWHRRVDPWLLLGVCAIAARLWTYHRIYDDILILLPTIAAFRLFKQASDSSIASTSRPSEAAEYAKAYWSGLVFTLAYLAAVMPANLLAAAPIISSLFTASQVAIWLSLGIFLGVKAWQERVTVARSLSA